MTFLLDDDAQDAFQAALLFVDEFQAPLSPALEVANTTDSAEEAQRGAPRHLGVESHVSGSQGREAGEGDHFFLDALAPVDDDDDDHVGGVAAFVGTDAATTEVDGESRHHLTEQDIRVVPSSASIPISRSEEQQVVPAAPTAKRMKLSRVVSIGGSKSAKPPRSDPNKARNERKQELIYLHKKVAELETQLSELELRNKRKKIEEEGSSAAIVTGGGSSVVSASSSQILRTSATGAPLPPPRAREQDPVVSRVWQELATRQRLLRDRSERENIRLRVVLEHQLKVAKSLERTLMKPSSTQEIEKCLQGPHALQYHAHATGSSPDASDSARFEELLRGVEQCYAEIDPLFDANGLARFETTYKDARMRRNEHGGDVYLEIAAAKLLPFDLQATGDAVWHHFVFGKEKIPNRFHSEKAPKVFLPSISSYLKNFGLEVHANHTSASFRVKQALRQYTERDRIVIVWQAQLDSVAFSDKPLPNAGVGFLEKGYIVIRRPHSISPQDDVTVLQTCHIITPNLLTASLISRESEDDPGYSQLGALTDFVLRATAANVTTSHHIIEDVLLEQSREAKCHRARRER